jgi:hypothetical protein
MRILPGPDDILRYIDRATDTRSDRSDPEVPVSDLLNRQRLFFNQKAKLIEMNIDFAIHDENGAEVGRIRQDGQSTVKKLARFVSSIDQFMSTRSPSTTRPGPRSSS